MSKRGPTFFAKALSRYFFDYLPTERNLSTETIQSYRDAMSLLLEFCEKERQIQRDRLEVNDLTRELIESFLRWLEREKRNSISTRNQRRAAISAFFKFLQYEDPACVLMCQQVREIPPKKCEQKIIQHLSVEAVQTVFEQPNLATREGRRDFAFLSLIYESAARASEIAGVRVGDIHFEKKGAIVHLSGKGRKFRDVPLLSDPAKILRNYLSEESRYRQCDMNDGQEHPGHRRVPGIADHQRIRNTHQHSQKLFDQDGQDQPKQVPVGKTLAAFRDTLFRFQYTFSPMR